MVLWVLDGFSTHVDWNQQMQMMGLVAQNGL